MISVFDMFKIGIGPSSSHTVGPMKAGKQFIDDLIERELLKKVTQIQVDVYGSLSMTGHGHGTDIAIIMGLAGYLPHNVDIEGIQGFIANVNETAKLALAEGKHVAKFDPATDMIFHQTFLPLHENGMSITALADKEVLYKQTYYSIGGGFIVDEAHDVIQTSHTAKMVAQFVRRSRKYRNLMFIITQEPEDFAADNVIMHTRAMFNNSAYKIIMKLNKDATEGLEKLQDINENETFWVKNGFQQGDALLILGDRRIPIHVIATQNELWEMGAMLSSGKSN